MSGAMGEEEIDLYGIFPITPCSKFSTPLTVVIGLLSIERDATPDQVKKAYRQVRQVPTCDH